MDGDLLSRIAFEIGNLILRVRTLEWEKERLLSEIARLNVPVEKKTDGPQ